MRSEKEHQKLDEINSHINFSISILKAYFILKSEHRQSSEDDKKALRDCNALENELDEIKTIAIEIDSGYEI